MPVLCEFDITQRMFNFPRPFIDRPRLAHGLREIDIKNDANIRVSSTFQNLTKSSADCNIITWGDTTLWSAIVDVFALAPGDLEFLTGEHMRSLWNNPNSPPSVRIDFERPFLTPPKVVVFFNCIELERFRNWRLKTSATDIDVNGFTLHIGTCTSISTAEICPVDQPQLRHCKEISFNSVEFLKTPSIFIALKSFDIDCKAGLRINAYVNDVSTTNLTWHIDSWNDTVVYSAGATIIAFN
ncbi:hypothetical protein EI94DRAFT_1834965 [Lactarius quietus]|nr:hypothetical protein EI94DRAFT_1834965 [Lactarius quietus]